MAYQGMLEGRVVFRLSDLKQFDLTGQDIRDLMIKVPGKTVLSRHLLKGDFLFFFCHQSFQEFLSASFVAEMKSRQFSRFNANHLHKDRWSVVRTFVSGIIYDHSSTLLHDGKLVTYSYARHMHGAQIFNSSASMISKFLLIKIRPGLGLRYIYFLVVTNENLPPLLTSEIYHIIIFQCQKQNGNKKPSLNPSDHK